MPGDSDEPQTEPLSALIDAANEQEVEAPAPAPPQPPPPAKPSLVIPGPFAHDRFKFTTGLRAGEIATIRGDADQVLLTYRSFASITGVIAAFLSGIVLIAGAAAVVMLFYDAETLRALADGALTIVFASVIALLVPRIQVTLFDNDQPALTIAQRSAFPGASYIVATPNGTTLAELRKSLLSRLGRNRWTIWHEGRYMGDAIEESFFGALVRKFLGKFTRSFDTNVAIRHGGMVVGRIPRKTADVLELSSDMLDRRVAVALATLILGREP
ncbi:MAG: hypothetical protein ACTHQM_00045 [Thermoanaerobaculia bacterium]